jgi:L-serine/L-threonine ammonia-lyase
MRDEQIHIQTPLFRSTLLERDGETRVWLKMEALQPCGSFKARGIGHACRRYVEDGAGALLSSSGGNAGLAVAFAGRRLDVPVTVVVPETTKPRAIELLRAEGAGVVQHGRHWPAAHQHALAEHAQENTAYIHPFDDPNIWEGHASVIDEVCAEAVRPDAVVLSVGGGGLLCGVVKGLRRNDLGDVPVLAVETRGTDSLSASARAGRHVELDGISSVATSLGATKVTERAYALLSEHEIVPRVVPDAKAVEACRRFLDDHRVSVEPACGASLAAVYEPDALTQDKEDLLVIVCGGAGVTQELLATWREQAEATTLPGS